MQRGSTPEAIIMNDGCTPYYAAKYAKAPFELMGESYKETAICYMRMNVCCNSDSGPGTMNVFPMLISCLMCFPCIAVQSTAITLVGGIPALFASGCGLFVGGVRDAVNGCKNPEAAPEMSSP
jgi:hypothetical protein